MELARFIIIASVKVLGLLFLALLASKAVGALQGTGDSQRRKLPHEWGLYAVILVLVAVGALTIGYDVAAETYARASGRNFARREMAQALANAQRAVELRPGNLGYWQTLATMKFGEKQYASLIADTPTLQSLAGGKLNESDAYRLAVSQFLLGDFAMVHPVTQTLMRENRAYAAPYVLEGYTFMAERNFGQAAKVFFDVLQMFPSQQAAVEGLAHAHYLNGNRAAALSVLEQTARFRFPPEVRKRFESLKGLYAHE